MQPVSGGPGRPERSPELTALVERYDAVGWQAKESKIEDWAPRCELAGNLLDHNVLRTPARKYWSIRHDTDVMLHRGWAYPRELERLVGRFTDRMLLHRQALSCFNAVYAFAQKCGSRRARIWPAVARELRRAMAVLLLVRADLSSPVSPLLLQTDASGSGAATVYSDAVPLETLAAECRRPRTAVSRDDAYDAASGAGRRMAAAFDAPDSPAAWKIARKVAFAPGSALATEHINGTELQEAVDAVRWAARAPRTRRCRLVLQLDSQVAVYTLRKGRSSKPRMLGRCRRLAAVTLAHAIMLVPRWVPTDKNYADRPSRGDRVPGPCVTPIAQVRPRGAGQGGYAGVVVGEASNPGPAFWSDLLDANIAAETQARYAAAVRAFVAFVRSWGERCATVDDLDYWLAMFAPQRLPRAPGGTGVAEQGREGVGGG